MHRVLTLVLPAFLASGIANPSSTSPGSDASRWQAMARRDLDAVHARVLEAHPGVIDPMNPGFSAWMRHGYEQAKAHIPHVVSYDTAMAAVRFYTAGFEDGHLIYSDHVRGDFPIFVTGWKVAEVGKSYAVVATIPGWPVQLPPVGAVWTGCDGLSAEDVLRTKVAPFTDRRDVEGGRQKRITALWMRRPVGQDLVQCSFQAGNGADLTLPVAYGPITTSQFFDAAQGPDARQAKAAKNAFDLRSGVLWINAGNFQLSEESTDRQELDAMLIGLAEVDDAHTIIFDARGNRGGDSSIGDRIFQAATGGLEFEGGELDSLPRYYAQWRVSDWLVQYLESSTDRLKSLYGEDSARVREHLHFIDRVAAAKAAGQLWVEQDAGRALTRRDVIARNGRLRRFEGRVALLTDSGCASACLDFADSVLQVPGVVHAGEKTSADSVYMVGSRSRLPSGNVLVMPVKVWRNRTRGNNEPLIPDVAVDLDAEEAEIRRSVLTAIEPTQSNVDVRSR